MSNETNETIADIVAEMMDESHAGYASFLEWVGAKLRHYADRIEDAHKREIAELRECLKVAEDAISSASDAFRFCIENCELELSPKMIGKLCDDGQACERALSFIREKGGLK